MAYDSFGNTPKRGFMRMPIAIRTIIAINAIMVFIQLFFQMFRFQFTIDRHHTTSTCPSCQSNKPIFDIIWTKHAQNVAFCKSQIWQSTGNFANGSWDISKKFISAIWNVFNPNSITGFFTDFLKNEFMKVDPAKFHEKIQVCLHFCGVTRTQVVFVAKSSFIFLPFFAILRKILW